jgi:hypothetical protein
MTRRGFVGWILSAMVLLVAAVLLRHRWLSERLHAWALGQRARDMILGVDTSRGTATLQTGEEQALWRLARVVLPSGAGPSAEEVVLDRLHWRATRFPGYADQFRESIALLDEEARRRYGKQTRFADLGPSEAEAVVGPLLEGFVAHQLTANAPAVVLRVVSTPRHLKQYRMRRHVVNEILDGYYRSPLGWARVGYRSFPGACAGLTLYSQAPDSTTPS